MASGRTRQVFGTSVGTGADMNIRTAGFRPQMVEVYNVASGGLCHAKWTKTMADDSAFKTITAGTITFITTNGITPLSNGFSLGADTDLNVSGETFHWVAYE